MKTFLKTIGLSALMLSFCGVPLSIAADDLIAPTRSLDGEREVSGKLSVVSEPPDQQVFLDGSEIGRTPVRLKQVNPGPHELRVSRSETDLFVESGKTLTISNFKGAFIVVPEAKETAKEPPAAPDKPTESTKQMKPPEEKKPTEPTPWDRFLNKSSPNF